MGTPHDSNLRRSASPTMQPAVRALERVEELMMTECDERSGLRLLVPELVALEALSGKKDPGARLEEFPAFLACGERMDLLMNMVEAQRRELDLFAVLRIQDSELAHSNFLAWLLDPSDTHAIGSHFLRKFMERTVRSAQERHIPTVCPDRLRAIDWSETEVRREWRYIDILVLNRNAGFVCAIENKIWADEGIDPDGQSQLTTYRKVLEKEFPDFDRHMVFLSPSGIESSSDTERNFWAPENYVTVHQLVSESRKSLIGKASPEVLMLMNQYETTLRRNVVPETSDIGKLATEIYLEHREAIELIYQNRPDYRAGIKQIFKEAIAKQKDWSLGVDARDFIRFLPSDWRKFDALNTGTNWTHTNALLLFEFRCPAEPTETAGPGLVLGGGTDEALRRRLFETARQNPGIFNARGGGLLDSWTHLHEYGGNLLVDSDLGSRWADGSARAKLEERVARFAEEEFPQISRAVVECLEEYQTGDKRQAE